MIVRLKQQYEPFEIRVDTDHIVVAREVTSNPDHVELTFTGGDKVEFAMTYEAAIELLGQTAGMLLILIEPGIGGTRQAVVGSRICNAYMWQGRLVLPTGSDKRIVIHSPSAEQLAAVGITRIVEEHQAEHPTPARTIGHFRDIDPDSGRFPRQG